ncbi:MAG TPA: Rrf2 family transcriptional regulator [Acetobacteraceae bacterium]|nr:Rrf2 family transcriptional regulator [Acetobacteraceae bacterium]
MQLSTRGRYTVTAMVHLAAKERAARERTGDCRPVNLAEIAAAEGLSLCYLEQLFGKLRRAGLVASARGPGGGYRLARPACEMPVAEIILAVDEKLHGCGCEPERQGSPGCRTEALWDELGRQVLIFLAGLTLEDVVEGRVAGRAAPLLPCPSREEDAEAPPARHAAVG